MALLASTYDNNNNSKQMIRFVTERNNKKVILVNVGIEEENNYIYGSYLDTTVFHKELRLSKIDNKDSITIGELICANFNLIVKDPNADIAVRAENPLFSWFVDANGAKISYDNHLESYINLSKKYPDSRFLISNLATNITSYKSKEDLRKVYENFSSKHKNTIWAKHIERFLDEKKFQNISLPKILKKTNEKIIQDSSKYNLIIFTASWCVPCIEEIPLLKEIYNELSENVNFTFISIDDERGIPSFKNIIEKYNIPWRTLFAYQDIKGIRKKYFIEAIPYNILVYPNNENMESLDVRKQDDHSRLYSLIKSFTKQWIDFSMIYDTSELFSVFTWNYS